VPGFFDGMGISKKSPPKVTFPFLGGARIGSFRKLFFILCSRRPEGRLLVNQKKMGITDP